MKRFTLATILAIIFLAGCSSRQFYTKPSVFIHANDPYIVARDKNSSDYNKSPSQSIAQETKLQASDFGIVFCLDNSSNLLSYYDQNSSTNSFNTLDKYGNCKGYLSMVINKETEYKNGELKATASKLFFLSDRNCVNFQNDFYFKDLVAQSGFKLLDLNILGVASVNLGQLKEFSSTEIATMSKNLTENLTKRLKYKKTIYASMSKPDYNHYNMLNDIAIYDSLCSLHATMDYSDVNISVDANASKK